MYEARVLADSVPDDEITASLGEDMLHRHPHRLITVVVTFPRFILAEVNTHRVFSRNSASSRAIPPKILIERVKEDPFIPETFNKRVKGMGVGQEVDEGAKAKCEVWWLESRDTAVEAAEALEKLDVDKSRINRLLEPFLWHTAIISSTEWDNFFALRCPPGDTASIDFPAQLEFQKAAIEMRHAMRMSRPAVLAPGEWHLPLVPDTAAIWYELEKGQLSIADTSEDLVLPRVSAGRCAKVSYDTHDDMETAQESFDRQYLRLEKNGHLSPAEHQATPAGNGRLRDVDPSNFSEAWVQFRKLIPNEENLVGLIEQRVPWFENALDYA